jgi:hypothetical protein
MKNISRGDIARFTASIWDGYKCICKRIETGPIIDIVKHDPDHKTFVVIKIGQFKIHKKKEDVKILSDEEAMLWKLEN